MIKNYNIDFYILCFFKTTSLFALVTTLWLHVGLFSYYLLLYELGNLQKLKKIRKCLTLDAVKKSIALELVISQLAFANALYSGLPTTEICKLQSIQNIITGTDRHDSSTEALKSLHWLPIENRVQSANTCFQQSEWTCPTVSL